jgi:hypothetical protein
VVAFQDLGEGFCYVVDIHDLSFVCLKFCLTMVNVLSRHGRTVPVIGGLGILLAMNCLGLRRTLCGQHQGRSRRPK